MYRRTQVAEFLGGRTGYAYAAMAVAAAIGVAAIIAWQAAREALKVRYPRRVLAAQWSPALWGLIVLLFALAGNFGVLPEPVGRAGIMAAMGLATAVLVTAPIYFLRSSLAERALTASYAAGAAVTLAAFALAYWTLLQAAGEPHAGVHWTALCLLTWPMLLLLLGGVLAPWSLNRVRHT
jgi:cation transport ATPase